MAMKTEPIGYIDDLGYLYCAPCMRDRSTGPIPTGWEPTPDGMVYADSYPHSHEACDFCGLPVAR